MLILEGKSLSAAINSLQCNFGKENFSTKTVAKWYTLFQDGDYNCKNKKKSGRPRQIKDEQFEGIIASNPFASPAEVSQKLDVSTTSVYSRMKSLGYTLKLSRWVPHQLTEMQKKKRVTISRQLLAMKRNNRRFFK